MTLVEKQSRFANKVALLIIEANRRQYLITWGEAWRSPETCALYAKEGKGIAHSLHELRLAVDLVLFKIISGKLTQLSKTEDYRELGEWWESQSDPDLPLCWGGHFNDGNHFSAPQGGIK